jgi:hypothetical protein
MAASFNLEAAIAESSHRSNFGELRKGEVRRIYIPRTSANKAGWRPFLGT